MKQFMGFNWLKKIFSKKKNGFRITFVQYFGSHLGGVRKNPKPTLKK